MSLQSNDLLKTVTRTQAQESTTRLASVSSTTSGVKLQFFGETEPSQLTYKKTSNVPTLAVGDVVLLQKVGSSYIITGKVEK